MVGCTSEGFPRCCRAALGVSTPNQRFDTIIMGRATYDPALKEGITSPYPHLRQYVVSRSLAASPDPDVTLVSGEVLETVRALKAEDGMDIYLAGGGQLAGSLLEEIDDLIVKVYPVVAGAGTPCSPRASSPPHFALTSARPFDSGAVAFRYTRTEAQD